MSRHVPFLADEAIERDATNLLAEYEHARGIVLELPIPIEDVVEKHLKLRIEFDDLHVRYSVPRPANGQPDILGAIDGNGTIFIDQSLDPEEHPARKGRYRFTLGHETGHWRLHRDRLLRDGECTLVSSQKTTLHMLRSGASVQREEWQVNEFSACLLMPRQLLLSAWKRRFGHDAPFVFTNYLRDRSSWIMKPTWKQVGCAARSALHPWPEPNRCDHDPIFDRVAREFSEAFRVSLKAMRIRLEKLGLLSVDGRNDGAV